MKSPPAKRGRRRQSRPSTQRCGSRSEATRRSLSSLRLISDFGCWISDFPPPPGQTGGSEGKSRIRNPKFEISSHELDLDLIAPEAVPGIRMMPVIHERVDLAPVVRRAARGAAARRRSPSSSRPPSPRPQPERWPGCPRSRWSSPRNPARMLWCGSSVPGDPLVEGMRWAAENDRRAPARRPGPSLSPPAARPSARSSHDPRASGAATYLDLIRRLADDAPYDDRDTLRERGMAHHLQTAQRSSDGQLVCLVGAAHADRLAGHLDRSNSPATRATAPPSRSCSDIFTRTA